MRSKLRVVLWAGVGALFVGASIAAAQVPSGERHLGVESQQVVRIDAQSADGRTSGYC